MQRQSKAVCQKCLKDSLLLKVRPKPKAGLRQVTDRAASLFVRQAMRVLVSEGEQSLPSGRSGNRETVLGPIEQEVDGEPRLIRP